MFISVACGAISGFHSTQSPIMARCCRSEKMSQRIFYGAMVCEGIIALIWAAAACALFPITNGMMTGLEEAMAVGQSGCIYNICATTMGGVGVVLAMLGVIACPISSGDTAFRSARLTLADWFKLDQSDLKKRALLTVPLLGLGVVVSQLDYAVIWRYFAFTNQLLAMITLWIASMYLVKTRKRPWIAFAPATFMSAVTMTYLLGGEECLNLPPYIATPGGLVIASIFAIIFVLKAIKIRKANTESEDTGSYDVA
jgi:carbon starvation protein CstA